MDKVLYLSEVIADGIRVAQVQRGDEKEIVFLDSGFRFYSCADSDYSLLELEEPFCQKNSWFALAKLSLRKNKQVLFNWVNLRGEFLFSEHFEFAEPFERRSWTVALKKNEKFILKRNGKTIPFSRFGADKLAVELSENAVLCWLFSESDGTTVGIDVESEREIIRIKDNSIVPTTSDRVLRYSFWADSFMMLIAKTGELKFSNGELRNISSSCENIRIVRARTNEVYFIDDDGNYLFSKRAFKAAQPFKNGFACVLPTNQKSWRFIDKNGNEIPVPFSSPSDFVPTSNGLLALVKFSENEFNYLRPDGSFLFQKHLFSAKEFQNDLAVVRFSEKDGLTLIDSAGNVVVPQRRKWFNIQILSVSPFVVFLRDNEGNHFLFDKETFISVNFVKFGNLRHENLIVAYDENNRAYLFDLSTMTVVKPNVYEIRRGLNSWICFNFDSTTHILDNQGRDIALLKDDYRIDPRYLDEVSFALRHQSEFTKIFNLYSNQSFIMDKNGKIWNDIDDWLAYQEILILF